MGTTIKCPIEQKNRLLPEETAHTHIKTGPEGPVSNSWPDADQTQALMPLQSFMYCLIAGTSVYLFTPSVVGMTSVGTLTISSF